MKRLSMLSMLLAFMLIVSACSTASGVMMKEALVKNTEVESYESLATISLDVQSTLFAQKLSADVYTKQIDALNNEVHISVNDALLLLTGLQKKAGLKEDVTLKLLSKDGEMVVTSNQDEYGISLGKVSDFFKAMYGEEMDPLDEERLASINKKLMDSTQKLVKAFLKDYNFALKNIQNKGKVAVELPNGTKVDTQHIRVELSLPELVDMVEYSIKHVATNEEVQDAIFEMFADVVNSAAKGMPNSEGSLGEAELAELKKEFKQDMQKGLPEILKEIEAAKAELASDEFKPLVENIEIAVDMYLGADKLIYQNDLQLKLKYTPELEEAGLPQMFPIAKGDTITFTISQKTWNHNKKDISPVVLPAKLIPLTELMEAEQAADAAAKLGEDSLIGQVILLLDAMVPSNKADFVQLQLLDGGKALATTSHGEQELQAYQLGDKMMVPFRFAAQAMGGQINWDGSKQKIYAKVGESLIEVEASQQYQVKVNGKVQKEIYVEVKKGVSYIDAVALSKALGWYLNWDEETQTLFIVK